MGSQDWPKGVKQISIGEHLMTDRENFHLMSENLDLIAKMMPPSRTQMALLWLAQNLLAGERCIATVTGSKNYASPSWFVLTNRRLFFLSDQQTGILPSELIVEFDLKNLKNCLFKKKIFFSLGEVHVVTSSSTKVLDNVHPENGKKFVSSLLTTIKRQN